MLSKVICHTLVSSVSLAASVAVETSESEVPEEEM